jgi:hypothetical protein
MGEKPLDTRRPFTRKAALSSGLTPKQLRGRRFRRLLRGVFVEASVPRWDEERIDAALMLHDPTAVASHCSAARLLGVPVPTCPDEHVTVLDARHRRRREGVICHLDPAVEVTTRHGRRVVAARVLFLQLAAHVNFVDLVVIGDHLVRRRLATPESLRELAARTPGAAGRRARAAAKLVRSGVDSPMETRLRLLLVLAGIPEPQVNLTLRDVDGEPVRRFDLSWPDVKVVVEYDGRHHVEREETWERDLDRREAMDDDGWRLLVVTARGIYSDPERTVRRVLDVLRARRLPGLPVQPDDGWRPHFPGPPGWCLRARSEPVHPCGPRPTLAGGHDRARGAFVAPPARLDPAARLSR